MNRLAHGLGAQGPQLRRPRGRPGQAHLLTSLRRANVTPPRDVTATGIRGEENCWFSAQHIGSRAALGRLPTKTLDTPVRADTGLTLTHHMADAVRCGTACRRPESRAGFIELHIEQGPVLEAAYIPTPAS